MPSPLAEAFLMGILNGCYETPSKCKFLFDGNFACVTTCIGVYREYINTLGE